MPGLPLSTRPRRTRRLSAVAAALLVAVGCLSGSAATGKPADAAETGPAFPRTAAVFLAQDGLPSAAALARYDLVVLDNEWAHREPASYFAQLRTLNPRILLLAYVNLVDKPPQLGSRSYYANRYDLWQFDTPEHSRFPRPWLARTSSGAVLSEYGDTSMANLTDRAPLVNGQRFNEYAAEWVVRTVWSSGVWDGIFLDVWGDRIFGASRNYWDSDGDGTDEPDTKIYGPGNPWERGVDAAEQRLRQLLPEAVLVANGDRTLRNRQLDGRVFESFADRPAYRDPAVDLSDYTDLAAHGDHRLPGISITIDRRTASGRYTADDLRRARYFLTGTLLQNGYWAGMGVDYGQLADYDEFDGGGLGRGYLGPALASKPTAAPQPQALQLRVRLLADNLYRRDFEHGIVLHNEGSVARTVTLERPYRHLRGTMDPVTNDGSVVRTVTVPPHDGVVLLRG